MVNLSFASFGCGTILTHDRMVPAPSSSRRFQLPRPSGSGHLTGPLDPRVQLYRTATVLAGFHAYDETGFVQVNISSGAWEDGIFPALADIEKKLPETFMP